MATNPVALASETPRIRFDRGAQLRGALITVAFFAVFWDQLDFIPPGYGALVHAWVFQPDWNHGPLIPLFSAYLVYERWQWIRRSPVRYAWSGIVVLLAGLGMYLWSLSGKLLFAYAEPLSMMITLLGIIVLLCGWPVLRHAWLPWMYLFFAIPIPQRIYFALTDPLRRMAATVAATVLDVLPGVALEVHRVGSNLEYNYRGSTGVIGVADACSGMRSTVTLCALGVAVAFMSDRPRWQRIVLVLSCVPIATFCNFIRVTVTCWLHVFVDPKYASGQYHMMLGLLVILLAFGIFSGLGWVLNQLVVEEPETDAAA